MDSFRLHLSNWFRLLPIVQMRKPSIREWSPVSHSAIGRKLHSTNMNPGLPLSNTCSPSSTPHCQSNPLSRQDCPELVPVDTLASLTTAHQTEVGLLHFLLRLSPNHLAPFQAPAVFPLPCHLLSGAICHPRFTASSMKSKSVLTS